MLVYKFIGLFPCCMFRSEAKHWCLTHATAKLYNSAGPPLMSLFHFFNLSIWIGEHRLSIDGCLRMWIPFSRTLRCVPCFYHSRHGRVSKIVPCNGWRRKTHHEWQYQLSEERIRLVRTSGLRCVQYVSCHWRFWTWSGNFYDNEL